MPAHIRPAVFPCYWREGCASQGRYQVFNTHNASQGYFCKPHANRRVKELNA